jgi:hypothetical protein
MLDDEANRAMEDVRRRAEVLMDALHLTAEEKLYVEAQAEKITNQVTEQYLDETILRNKKIRPIAVAAAVAFSLTYFDKWVTEIGRKFPDLGK